MYVLIFLFYTTMKINIKSTVDKIVRILRTFLFISEISLQQTRYEYFSGIFFPLQERRNRF